MTSSAAVNLESRARAGGADHHATLYRHFLTTPVPIAVTDRSGAIVDVNQAFLDFYGYERLEVVGRNPRILKSGRQSPDAYREMWAQIVDPAIGYWTGELINRKRSGEEATVVLTVSAVRDDDGAVTGYVASAVDITRRKLLESQLSAMNRELEELSRLKSEVVAMTSHDLKSPINAIISRVRLLREEIDDLPRDRIDTHLARVEEAGERLTAFINELLDLERIEAGSYRLTRERQKVDALLRLCLELHEPAAAGRGVRLTFTAEDEAHPASVDGAKLEQVFTNLIANAIKFAPRDSEVEAVYRETEHGCEVAIMDRGPGIPEEDLERIFDRYYQVERHGAVPKRVFGAGLGLAIVKHIVDLHGGSVSASARSGGGSVFTVRLPERPAEPVPGLAVLVIDPGDQTSDHVTVAVRQHGDVTPFFARSAFEASRVLEHEHPDLVFFRATDCDARIARLLREYAARHGDRVTLVGIGGCDPRFDTCGRWIGDPADQSEILDLLRDAEAPEEP